MDNPNSPMPSQFNLELEIFAAALKLPGASARAAYLTDACAGDHALRQRVEALLSAHEDAGTYLQNSPPGARTAIAASASGTHLLPSTEKPGDKIGRYKLLQQIGEIGRAHV